MAEINDCARNLDNCEDDVGQVLQGGIADERIRCPNTQGTVQKHFHPPGASYKDEGLSIL